MVRLGSTQNPASKEKGHWPQEEPCSSHVKGRGAWPGLREPLPWRKRGVKAGPGARLGDIGLEVSLFGGMLSGSTWDFIRFCFLNWLGPSYITSPGGGAALLPVSWGNSSVPRATRDCKTLSHSAL